MKRNLERRILAEVCSGRNSIQSDEEEGVVDGIEENSVHRAARTQHIMNNSPEAASSSGVSSEILDVGSSRSIGPSCEMPEEEDGTSSEGSSPLGWPLGRRERANSGLSFTSLKSVASRETVAWEPTNPGNGDDFAFEEKKDKTNASFSWEEKRERRETDISEVEMMKERFAKLLLGEDMSGGGKGVCTALAISNAITNLAASVFRELWRLEPLSFEPRTMWKREMEWLLSVSDYIVELVPSWQNFSDGSNMEIMVTRPRSDLHINLPALRKLDTMLLESLDSFKETEFWYVDQGISIDGQDGQHTWHRQEEKWWLPSPKVPVVGLSDDARKSLQYQRECTNQILKAAMAINSQVLSEMEVPDVYWETLPKNGRACLGEILYRGLISENFSSDGLLSQLDLSTEHGVLEIANRIESAIHVWQRKAQNKQSYPNTKEKHTSKSSWGKVRDYVGDLERRSLLAERCESLLLSLKQRFPGLPQTVLDINKIQYNKDVGQSILESYSRVLESLAFNIMSRIDDVIYIDDATKQALAPTSLPATSRASIAMMRRLSGQFSGHVPISTPYATPFASPSVSPSSSPSIVKRTSRMLTPQMNGSLQSSMKTCEYSICEINKRMNELGSITEEPRKMNCKKEWSWSTHDRNFWYSPPERD